MKKLLGILAFVAICSTVRAQELGVRFGDALGNVGAVDALFSTGKYSRIHADVSFGGHGVGVDALWDFLYRPLRGEAFHWYVGAGFSTLIGDPFKLGASAEAGLSYYFKFPLSLSADWRPTLYIINDGDGSNFHAGGFGVNARWVFGKRNQPTQ